jgi:hypothetical protein
MHKLQVLFAATITRCEVCVHGKVPAGTKTHLWKSVDLHTYESNIPRRNMF